MHGVKFVFFGLDSDFSWLFCQHGLEISGFKVSDQPNGGELMQKHSEQSSFRLKNFKIQ